MYKILIFGGTTEGHQLYDFCCENNIAAIMCVATDYGKNLLNQNASVVVHEGRLDSTEMELLIKEHSISLVLDATHPYAVQVTDNIQQACQQTDAIYKRIVRARDMNSLNDCDVKIFYNISDAVDYLKDKTGNVFASTGSKELKEYLRLEHFESRLYARILPEPEALRSCMEMGIIGRHISAMQGPFSEEMNYAFLKEFSIKYFVTKASGKTGGFEEKIRAASRAGVQLIVIEKERTEQGITVEDAMLLLEEYT